MAAADEEKQKEFVETTFPKLAADGSYRKLIKKYAKTDVLILDEWLLMDLSKDEAR